MRVFLILAALLSSSVFAQDTIGSKEIEAITKASDLDKYEEATFLPIYSEWGTPLRNLGKKEKKNCGFTRFPEEYTQDFKQGGVFQELKKYYDLKSEEKSLDKARDPENNAEYVNRRQQYQESQLGIRKLQEALNAEVPFDKIRHKKLQNIIQGDPEEFEKTILRAGSSAFSAGFVYENGDVREVINRVMRRHKKEIKDIYVTHDHYFSWAKGVEKAAERAKKLYPSVKWQIKELEKDKEVMDLAKKYDRWQVREMIEQHEDYKRSKNLTIMFEGTGQYSPKLERNLKLIQSKLGMNASQEDIDKATEKAIEISDDTGYFATQEKVSTWSGTIRGPIAKGLYKGEKGLYNFRDSQWLYLPSEQDNSLADAGFLSFEAGKFMSRDEAYSRGLQCLKQYLKLYPDTNISIVGHSSGVKAAIDFAEELKKEGIKGIDMLGIDPVDNMMKGGLEGAISGAFAKMDKLSLDLTPDCLLTKEDKARSKRKSVGVVMSKKNENLYKPDNVSKFVSYYQTQDMVGLGDELPIVFGIHGSPVRWAENHHIRFLDEDNKHHGTITQDKRVIDDFRRTLVR